MTVNGIGGSAITPGMVPAQPRATKVEQEDRRAVGSRPQVQPQPAAAPNAAVHADPAMLSAAAPEGTDPALWNVLTTEERAFFSKIQSLGPLTYGPRRTAAAPVLGRGGRLDLTV